MLTLLVIGSGGREHALAWKLAQSSLVTEVHCAPGNGGTALEPKVINHPSNDVLAWMALAKKIHADLVVVGPEQPLAEAIVDAFQAEGIRVVGPRQSAAQLESSKAFAKSIMKKAGIPTARFITVNTPEMAYEYLRQHGAPLVIKADGLAAGKGVVVAQTLEEAENAIEQMMVRKVFGSAGRVLVMEDCLMGEEASFIVLTDGKVVAPFSTSQDHKRLLDGDLGPNTGGMGAYTPAPIVTPKLHDQILDRVIYPLLHTLKREIPATLDHPQKRLYAGFLYAGIMIAPDGTPNVLEFNCRLGDPETQPLMMSLSADLADVLMHLTEGELHEDALMSSSTEVSSTIGVVLASGGYPQSVLKDKTIEGLALAAAVPHVKVFHASTRQEGDKIVVNGGRVLCVTARGKTLKEARESAYSATRLIHFEGMQYRQDIGFRAL